MAQIYEIFGKRLRVEHNESGSCDACALAKLNVCDDTLCCYDGEWKDNRRFIEVDSDGNDVEK